MQHDLIWVGMVAGGSAIMWWSGWLFGHHAAAVSQESAVPGELAAGGRGSLRRPAEWGPLLLPQDEVERIRVAIFADQFRAGSIESAVVQESAVYAKSTERVEPAEMSERTVELEPAASVESAELRESATHRESAVEAEHTERFMAWLWHYQDDGLLALTGAA